MGERGLMRQAAQREVARAVLGAIAIVAVFAFCFVYPAHDPTPHQLPVAVTGANADGLAARLSALGGGDLFAVKRYREERGALRAMLDREVYATFIARERIRLDVTSAASPQVAELLKQVAAEANLRPALTDLKPLDEDDPRGASINLITLALTISSIIGAVLLALLAPELAGRSRLLAVALFASCAGVAAIAVVSIGIGVLPGSMFALAAVAAVGILAVAATAAGLLQLLGPPGLGLSFLLFLLFAVPASGAASAPELLPVPWSSVGQYLPAGALATGLRNVAYFDWAGAERWLVVLGAWALIGAVLLITSRPRRGALHASFPAAPREPIDALEAVG